MKIELKSITANERANDCFILFRLDIGEDYIHKNPDGKKIIGHHLHKYKEGYGDKYAYSATDFGFTDPTNLVKSLNRFFELCNIEKIGLEVQGRL